MSTWPKCLYDQFAPESNLIITRAGPRGGVDNFSLRADCFSR
jgi:hypothetical protein